jgi:hypothetical protein
VRLDKLKLEKILEKMCGVLSYNVSMEHLHNESTKDGINEAKPVSIISAAIKFNGETYTGINHAFAIRKLESEVPNWRQKSKEAVLEGFMTSSGAFVDRDEALRISENADQIRPDSDNTYGLDSHSLQ